MYLCISRGGQALLKSATPLPKGGRALAHSARGMSQKCNSEATFDCGMSRLTWRNSAPFQDHSATRNAACNSQNPSASCVRRTCTAVSASDFSSEFRFRSDAEPAVDQAPNKHLGSSSGWRWIAGRERGAVLCVGAVRWNEFSIFWAWESQNASYFGSYC